MKNTIKMSLAAAVAVSAFSTSAFAGNLEEMIKGVTASGKINVEYQNDAASANATVAVPGLGVAAGAAESTTNQTEYDIDMTFKIPVNDMVTATIGFQADHDTSINTTATSRTGVADDVDVTQVNFTYANGPVTAIVGKQNVGTPFLYDQKGDGIVALYNAGPVTLAAAHFVNSNADILTGNALRQGAETINAVAAIGSVAGINLSAWYVTTTLASGDAVADNTLGTGVAGLKGALDGAAAYTLNANGKIGPVGFDVRHSSAEIDGAAGNNFDAEELTKLTLTADVDMFSFAAAYATTNDTFVRNGGRLHGVSWDDDDTTETGFNGEQAYLDTLNDADAFLLGVSSSFDKFAVGVTYIDGEADSNLVANDNIEFSELILSASYAMSKNFKVSSYYSMYDVDYSTTGVSAEVENDEFSLALTYKF